MIKKILLIILLIVFSFPVSGYCDWSWNPFTSEDKAIVDDAITKTEAFTQDGGVLVGTAVPGVYAEEFGTTLRTSIGCDPIGTDNSDDNAANTLYAGLLPQSAQFSFDPGTKYNSSSVVWIADLITSRYPYGIVITAWAVDCDVADPNVEMDLDLMYCDAVAGGAFPGANPVLIDVMDTTTGNSAETDMSNSDLGSGIIPTLKSLYLSFGADPEGTCTQVHITIEYTILTS